MVLFLRHFLTVFAILVIIIIINFFRVQEKISQNSFEQKQTNKQKLKQAFFFLFTLSTGISLHYHDPSQLCPSLPRFLPPSLGFTHTHILPLLITFAVYVSIGHRECVGAGGLRGVGAKGGRGKLKSSVELRELYRSLKDEEAGLGRLQSSGCSQSCPSSGSTHPSPARPRPDRTGPERPGRV